MSPADRPELHKLCGLKELPNGGTGWHEVIIAGLPVRGIRATARAIQVKDVELAELLGLDESILEAKDDTLARDPSNFLYRVALAYTRTLLKMGWDEEKARNWLRTAQPTIRGYVPILLLQSHIGCEYVFAAIERLEPPKDRVIQQDEAPDAGTAEFEHQFDEEDEDDSDPFSEMRDDE